MLLGSAVSGPVMSREDMIESSSYLDTNGKGRKGGRRKYIEVGRRKEKEIEIYR